MAEPAGLLITGAEILGHGPHDCRITDGLITELGAGLGARPGEPVLRAEHGALIPGLADHHLHLTAMAAAAASVDAAALDRDALGSTLHSTVPDPSGWIRVIGYDDTAHGDLDRSALDAWRHDVPVRVQHRSGALWVLNTRAVELVGAVGGPDGVERDPAGYPTGRLWRADPWLRAALDSTRPPGQSLTLADVGARLASYGITHVTDATPHTDPAGLIASAVETGAVPQHVLVLAADAPPSGHPRLRRGPVKLVVGDHDLPDPDELAARIAEAHERHRPVAVHCVTRTGLALTLAALDVAGTRAGDRIEHAAIADPDLAAEIAARGLRVVTQPSMVACRGDDYWARTEPSDREHLWPYATLLGAGVQVAASSDAPYGDPDPWSTLRTATDRRTRSRRVLGEHERVATTVALAGMLSALTDPGGRPRRIAVGERADLVLLDRPLGVALRDLDSSCVRATLVAGRIVHQR